MCVLPVGVHLSSSLFIIGDELLVDFSAVLHPSQRIFLVTFPHHKQDHDDWRQEEEEEEEGLNI